MAEIVKRENTYRISVFLGRDESGKKIMKHTTYVPTAKTPKAIEKEVRSFAEEYEKRVKSGDVLDGEEVTFRQFVSVWKENALSNVSQKQREAYERDIDSFFVPVLGFVKLSNIKAPHIDAILKKRKESGAAARTIRFSFTAINSVMTYAFKKNYIRENPCLRCDDLPSVVKDSKLHYWTVEQAKTFMHALTLEYPETREASSRKLSEGKQCKVSSYTMNHKIPVQYRAFFSIAIYGGLRRGEICSLTWEDIDFTKRTVTVRKSISRPKSGEYIKAPKTEASKRTIRLPAQTMLELKLWRAEEEQLATELGSAWTGYREEEFDKNWLFINLDSGERICVDTPTHKFREIIELYNSHYAESEEEELPVIRLHDLRHTSATLLLAHNTDIETVQKRLGHSRASITLDIYGHALEEMDDKASDTLERIFA